MNKSLKNQLGIRLLDGSFINIFKCPNSSQYQPFLSPLLRGTFINKDKEGREGRKERGKEGKGGRKE